MKKIRIGIVDDNKDFCEVVSENLSAQENIEVLFTANDGLEAIEELKTGQCPDILILDLIMPVISSGRNSILNMSFRSI